MTLDELANLHNDTDSEDEEINEDEAFNSEDEEVYGKYLSSGVSSKIRSKNLSLSMPLSQSDDSTATVRIVEIARGSKMTLSSVCLDVSSMFDFHQIKLAYRCVYRPSPNNSNNSSSNREDDFFCLVNYLSAKKGGMGLMPSTLVNLEVIGPCKVEFKSEIVGLSSTKKSVDGVGGSRINIFGVVMPVDNFMGDDVPYPYADAFLSEEEENDSGMIESDTENASGGGDDKNGDGAVDGKNDDTVVLKKPTKKRKLEEEDKTDDKASKLSTTTTTAIAAPTTTPAPAGNTDKKLTKSQRKKLAREKAKQLEETLSAARNDNKNDENDDDDGDDDNDDAKDNNNNNTEEPAKKKSKKKKKKSSAETTTNAPSSPKPTSMTRERRLPGGLLISDMILGTGPPVKPGKRISLHYTGSLRSNGNVFDKNNSKQHPLVFRQGTGEVIRGLERGLEGMKVGGERVITIPSKLGYGRKGSGVDIPPDSDLVFEVKVLKVG